MKRRIPTLFAAVLLSTGAFSQIQPRTPTLPVTPIASPPSAPSALTQGDLQALHGGRTPLVLQWTQIIPTGTGPWLYPPATHFVICFRAVSGGSAPACNLSSHDSSAVVADLTASTSPFARTAASTFRFSPMGGVQESQLDQPYRFTVGACSAWLERSCRYSSADVFYSTRNLFAMPAQKALASSDIHWKIDARATNTGDSDIPMVNVTMELFEVLYKTGIGPGRSCETDVDDNARRHDVTLIVLDKNGGRTKITQVSRDPVTDQYDGPEVAGIFRVGSFSTAQTLPTNATAIGVGQVDQGIRVFDFPIAVGVVQRPFVILTTLDSGNAVREFNENDNSSGKRRIR